MGKILVIGITNLRRTYRVRSNFFLSFVFPLLLILILGQTFGSSSQPRVGVVYEGSGPLGRAVASALGSVPGMTTVTVNDAASLQLQVERATLDGGVIIPSDFDQTVGAGRTAVVKFIAWPGRYAHQLSEDVNGAVARESALLGAAQFAVNQNAVPSFDAGVTAANAASSHLAPITVSESTAGTARFSRLVTEFDQGAWTQLDLFVFFMALMGGALGLIQSRRLGVARRMLATPTSTWTVIGGEVFSRFVIAVIQAIVIVFGSALLFQVAWGQPAGVAATILVYGVVSAAAGVLLGSLVRNEQQAAGVALLLGLGLAALGGSMVPIQVFPQTMQTIAHITPHAWANEAYVQLVGNGVGLTAILPQLAVLAAYAVGLLALASWRLHRVLTS
ncbi:MAG TPA: ABC transporter permease [Candidatus Dormibacteraeota bacterium]|nr:ABC transporter permease [Candidatus Dormibacteraeota bacterium]